MDSKFEKLHLMMMSELLRRTIAGTDISVTPSGMVQPR